MRSGQLLAPWRWLRLRSQPAGLTRRQRRDFFYTQMDALWVGLVMAVTPFLAVSLTWLTAYIGLGGALILGTCVRLAGFGLFLSDRGNRESRGRAAASG